jgi:hypothetical protein
VLSAEKLEETAERIRRESRLMKSVLAEPLENRAEFTDFPMTPKQMLCRGCNFQKLCHPHGLDADPNKEFTETVH